jgi:hypothetical protein
MSETVDGLLQQADSETAPPFNAYEVAALIESFGYNDRAVGRFGFSDVFALGEYIFSRCRQQPVSGPAEASLHPAGARFRELGSAMRKLSASLAYSVPWMALLALEYLRPKDLQVSPQLGAASTLALIASLIAAGGFVQMISRSGTFYFGLQEPVLARRSCVLLMNLGLIASLFAALAGLIVGLYFHIFAGVYLVLAAATFVTLSLLWMLCAVLSAQGRSLYIPVIFVVSGCAAALVKVLAHSETSTVLMIGVLVAILCALGCGVAGFYWTEKKAPGKDLSAPPRLAVMVLSLLPFYLYGTAYFSFVFADRLVAGTAIPWAYGLNFGIDFAYKRGMDLVLLAFLITAALVEYLSDFFLRSWFKLAAQPYASGDGVLSANLRTRHRRIVIMILVVFLLISFVAGCVLGRVAGLFSSRVVLETAVLGGLGYLMLSVALFESIILASLNSVSPALRAMALGLAVNLLIGYGLSHLLAVQYAGAGLLTGSAVVLWKCNAAVRQVLRHPDYHYATA